MHLTLHLTRACNMRCRYCYAPPTGGAGMSERVGREAMRFGLRANRGSCGIVFFGGEPLLEKDRIISLVTYGRELQHRGQALFHFKITTNGLLLDDKFLEFAVRNEILFAFSFDGVREAHDANRVRPDGSPTFDVLLARLRRLLEVKPYASVIMVVNPNTVAHFAAGVEFLFDLGLRYLVLALNFDADWTDEHVAELGRQYTRLARRYVQWTRAGRKFYFSPFEVKLSSHINRGCFDRERCDLGRRQLSVDPDGFLYPCVQFPKAGPDSPWCVGNIFDGVNQQRVDELNAASRREKEICVGCELTDRCLKPCACLNWQTTGTITQVSPLLCRHEKLLTPIVDRVGAVLYRRHDPLFIQKHYNAAYPILSLLEDGLSADAAEILSD